MAKILIVEDIADSANLAKKILTKFEHDVVVAATGEEGFDMAVEHCPDLILLDLGLPDVDGQTLMGMMRQQPCLENTQIIVCTAWPEDTARTMAREYGFDGYISKPYRVTNFMAAVNGYLYSGFRETASTDD
jgi:CheY-like chemotaxis protein